jgi:acyl carrier protein
MTQPVHVRSGDTPTETVAAVVARLLAEQGLSVPDSRTGVDTPLTSLGVDSIGLVKLVSELENIFGVTLGPEDLQLSHFATVASLCALVARCGGTQASGAASAVAGGSGASPAR